jgi:hypothetical protein
MVTGSSGSSPGSAASASRIVPSRPVGTTAQPTVVPVRRYGVVLALDGLSLADAATSSDTFTLASNLGASVTRRASEATTEAQGAAQLEITPLVPLGTYTLSVQPPGGAAPRTIFRDVPYDRLGGLTSAAAAPPPTTDTDTFATPPANHWRLAQYTGAAAASGFPTVRLLRCETRVIVIAQGTQFQDGDIGAFPGNVGTPFGPPFDYLRAQLGTDFHVRLLDDVAEYTSEAQRVHFRIYKVRSKRDFKRALETDGTHVIYSGHARDGRGACFGGYAGQAPATGELWERGTSDDDGIFRLGYPYVAVPLSDLTDHGYTFTPVPVESPQPAQGDIEPANQGPLSRVTLPAASAAHVDPAAVSPSNRYWGRPFEGSAGILLVAGWTGTPTPPPYTLGGTTLRCKCFCHFGCSSRPHFWGIVRQTAYKGWQRAADGSGGFAYFTTDTDHPPAAASLWIQSLLSYTTRNGFQSWYASLEGAKSRTNSLLRSYRETYQIY